MSDYRLVRYERRHHEAVAWFRHSVFGYPLARTSAFLRWKYVDNPYDSEPGIYLALQGDRVVGMRGVCGGKWEADGQAPELLLTGVDTGLHPEHRDGSLYRELNEFTFADLASRGHHRIISLSPTPEAYLAAVLTLGWKGIGSLGYLVRTQDSATSGAGTSQKGMRVRLGSVARRISPAMSLVRWRRKRAPFNRFDKQMSRLTDDRHVWTSDTPKADLMADLVERIGTDRRIRHVRDTTYLNWRYRNPANPYRFLYWGTDSLEGYLALMKGTTTGPAYILDWEATDPEVASALLNAIVHSNAFPHLRIWGVNLPAIRREMLTDAGFAEPPASETSRHADRFIVRALGTDSPEQAFAMGNKRLDQVADWDLRMVYSTAF